MGELSRDILIALLNVILLIQCGNIEDVQDNTIRPEGFVSSYMIYM